ncbi:DUF445 family protein [Algivirga pacifica]|uniref:DUF445 domain-containing protein n=1 Tax=Algivirga pacifica TaxID=1162670 RepID=A0ABP9D0M7_9BACT
MLSILLKIFTGATVGYTTNDLALRMLFERVLGIPSVVEQTKEEFIENISKLVESEIIHHDNIGKELRKPAFKQAITALFTELVQERIGEQLPDSFKVEDVPGITPSFEAVTKLLLEETKGPLEECIFLLLEGNVVEGFISEEQLRIFSSRSFDILFEHAQTQHLIDTFVQALWEEVQHKPLTYFLSTTLTENLQIGAHQLFEDYLNYVSRNWKGLAPEFLEVAELQPLLRQMAHTFSQKKLTELLGNEHATQSTRQLSHIIYNLVQDDRQEGPVKTLIAQALDILEKEDTPLLKLFPEDLQDKLTSFIRSKLPSVLNVLIQWIGEHKEEIDHMINHAFYANSSRIGGWVMYIFVESVSERFKIVDEIIHITKEHTQGDKSIKLAEKGTETIISFFQTNSIGHIIKFFGKASLTDQLYLTIRKVITPEIVAETLSSQQSLLESKVNDLWNEQLQEKHIALLLDFVKQSSGMETLIKQDFIKESGERFITNQLLRLLHRPVDSLFSKALVRKKSSQLEKNLLGALQQRRSKGIQAILTLIKEKVTPKNWSYFIQAKQLQGRKEQWLFTLKKFIDDKWQAFRSSPVIELIHPFTQRPDLPETLADGIIGYTDRNLYKLMEGQVSGMVKESLQLKHQELPEMVKGFMGSNMKPITYFGALLGAIAGGLTWLIPHQGELTMQMMGISATVFGITGLGTNWLAIRMVFRPYNAKYFMGIRIPFTPGIMAKNKQNFADQMGKFVGKELLNEASVGEGLQRKLQEAAPIVKEKLSQRDFFLTNKLIISDKKAISQKAGEFLSEYLQDSSALIAKEVIRLLHQEEDKIAKEDLPAMKEKLLEITQYQRLNNNISAILAEQLTKVAKSTDPMTSWMPEEVVEALSKQLERGIGKYLNNNPLTTEGWLQYTERTIIRIFQKYENVPLKETPFIKQNETLIYDTFWSFIEKQIQEGSIEQYLLRYIHQQIQHFLESEQNIAQTLQGKIFKRFQEALPSLFDYVLTTLSRTVAKEMPKIQEEIYRTAYEKRRLVFLYEGTIKRSTKSLLEDEVPSFIRLHQKEIIQMLQEQVLKISQESRLEDLGVTLEQEAIQQTLKKIMHNPNVLEGAKRFYQEMVSKILLLTPKDLVAASQTTEKSVASHLVQLMEAELLTVEQHWKYLIHEQKEPRFHQFIQKHVGGTVKELLGQHELRHYLNYMSDESLETSIRYTLQRMTQTKAFDNSKIAILEHLLLQIQHHGFETVIDKVLLEKDLQKGLTQLLKLPHNQQLIQQKVSEVIQAILEKANNALTPDLKHFLLETMVNAGVSAATPNIGKLVGSIDFKGIVIQEINQMDNAKIEELFYGFAGVYFQRLILYGLLLGLPLGLLLDSGLEALLEKMMD